MSIHHGQLHQLGAGNISSAPIRIPRFVPAIPYIRKLLIILNGKMKTHIKQRVVR